MLSDVDLRWAGASGVRRTARRGDAGAAQEGTAYPDDVLALDRLAELLLVAGWPTAARQARVARDGLRSPRAADTAAARRGLAVLTRRVERSRPLAWSVGGIGVLPHPTTDGWSGTRGDGAGAGSDVVERVRYWCALARGDRPTGPWPAFTPAQLAAVLDGTELASARLTVASVLVLAGETSAVGPHRE